MTSIVVSGNAVHNHSVLMSGKPQTQYECKDVDNLGACVLYFCICTCSAQLSMFHMERRSRNTLIIIIINIFKGKMYK